MQFDLPLVTDLSRALGVIAPWLRVEKPRTRAFTRYTARAVHRERRIGEVRGG